MTNRLKYFDVLSGFLIIFMIVEHIQSYYTGYNCYLFHFKNLLSFYMPFFFFKSGILSKENSGKEVLTKNYKKLLIPYIVWGFISYFCILACLKYEGSLTLHNVCMKPMKDTFILGSFLVEGPTWFLLTLLIVKVLGAWITTNTNNVAPAIGGVFAGSLYYLRHL